MRFILCLSSVIGCWTTYAFGKVIPSVPCVYVAMLRGCVRSSSSRLRLVVQLLILGLSLKNFFFFSLSLWPANSSEISYETTSSRKKIELTLATNEERKSKIARNSREQEPCQPLAFIAFLPTPLLYSAENQLICTFRSTTIVGCPFQSNLQL